MDDLFPDLKKDFENAGSLICSGQMAGMLSIDKNWEIVLGLEILKYRYEQRVTWDI